MPFAVDLLALSGAIAAAIAAVAGIVAAVYAVRTFGKMGVEGKRAEDRHLAEIQPRPSFQSASIRNPSGQAEGPAFLDVRPINPGGAATSWNAVVHAGTFAFLFKGSVPAHYVMPPGDSQELNHNAAGLTECTGAAARFLASYPLDVEGKAWDVLTGQRTSLSLIEYFRAQLAPWGIGLDDQGNLQAIPRITVEMQPAEPSGRPNSV